MKTLYYQFCALSRFCLYLATYPRIFPPIIEFVRLGFELGSSLKFTKKL